MVVLEKQMFIRKKENAHMGLRFFRNKYFEESWKQWVFRTIVFVTVFIVSVNQLATPTKTTTKNIEIIGMARTPLATKKIKKEKKRKLAQRVQN